MSGISLLISFFVVTIGWQIVAQTAGPWLAAWLYKKRVTNLQGSGLSFENDAAREAWAQKNSVGSINHALLILAAACGAIAGMLGFPLIGLSRSTNVWSWLRIIVLCGVS